MDQSSLHVAIIMDGNGRWATRRGLPRIAGHREGAKAVRRAVEAAPELGVRDLTLYAFSSDNWQRPAAEVNGLMEMFERYLGSETENCVKNGIRLSVIGRRDRLATGLAKAIHKSERATKAGGNLHLRLAVDYSARDAILSAARHLAAGDEFTRETLSRGLAVPDVDLLVRTGGEQRLSDFLLWECAYAELYFTPRMWPEFGREDLEEALRYFANRERRFGAVEATPQAQRLAS
jgi:undecaprenyl diphosphate synthase